jgi:NAD(P)H-hydrate epimerase
MSTHEQTCALVLWLVQHFDKPMVIDADGLNCLSEKPDLISKAKAPLLLTPHPGELARLLKTETKTVLANPIDSASDAADSFNADIILKVTPVIIASRSGEVYLNKTGNPGMATAGMGDVLTGVTTGLIAQGLNSTDAAVAGVYLHGLAGDLAAGKKGKAGLLAGDLLKCLPEAFQQFE